MTKQIETENKIGIFSVGTAGHVIPGTRIVEELMNRGVSLDNLIIVTGNRDEKRFYESYKVEILEYDYVKTEKSVFYYIKNISRVIKSLLYLNGVIESKKITVIFTTGSYISPLVCFLGFIKGIPSFIQEQNIYGGLGNYIGSYFAKKVYTSFPNTKHIAKNKVHFVGPILPKPLRSIENNILPFKLGVQGGSQGSKEINKLVYETFQGWDGFDIELHHITGGLEVTEIKNEKVNYIKYDYVKDINIYYQSIKAQITRGGGGILEGASIGCVQIILPYKYGTTPTHQTNNASYLVNKDAAFLIHNDVEVLKEIIYKLGQSNSEEYSPTYMEFSMNSKNAIKRGGKESITDELLHEYKKNI